MKKTPERIEKLASEYVLGSLKGPARARFEAWMMESYRTRQEVWFWESHLAGLMADVPRERPAPENWDRIAARLWPTSNGAAKTGAGFWRPWSLIATAASLLLAVALTVNLTREPAPAEPLMAVVSGGAAAAQPLWIFNSEDNNRQLLTRAVSAQPAAPDKDYELWVLPESGPPLSLGTLRADGERIVINLSEEQRRQLLDSKQLAISLEPRGGSPTGTPTGPVLYTTELLEL